MLFKKVVSNQFLTKLEELKVEGVVALTKEKKYFEGVIYAKLRCFYTPDYNSAKSADKNRTITWVWNKWDAQELAATVLAYSIKKEIIQKLILSANLNGDMDLLIKLNEVESLLWIQPNPKYYGKDVYKLIDMPIFAKIKLNKRLEKQIQNKLQLGETPVKIKFVKNTISDTIPILTAEIYF